jgi:Tfp pilus assembly protein PilF
VELNEALSELRQLDTARITQVYVSREMLEHAIGVIHQAAGDTAAARQAYGRALQENLAYASPHVLLAGLDLLGGDTTTALSEFEVAVQVAPAEAPLRVAYGLLLAQAGHRDDAVVHLRRAAELEPYYATPHYLLGYVAELQGNREDALAGYRAFLARASARDRLHDMVAQRIVDLSP